MLVGSSMLDMSTIWEIATAEAVIVISAFLFATSMQYVLSALGCMSPSKL